MIHPKYHKKSTRASHKLGENICNTYNQQRISTQDIYESIRKKTINGKMGRRHELEFHKKENSNAHKNMKGMLHLLVIKKMQVNTIMKYCFIHDGQNFLKSKSKQILVT